MTDYDILDMFNIKLNTKYKSKTGLTFEYEFEQSQSLLGVVICHIKHNEGITHKSLNDIRIRVLRNLEEVKE